MKKRIHKEEFLFDVKDTAKIKLGTNLHIPHIDSSDGFDWCVESLLMAIEIATKDKTVDYPNFSGDALIHWEFSYYCRINGIAYKVTESKESMYRSSNFKIELV